MSASTSPLRCSCGRRSARASSARPCLKSSWARCTPEEDDGAGAGAADPFFAIRSPPREPQEGVHLLAEVGRHLGVHVGEDRLDRGRRDPFGLLNRTGDLVPDLLFEPGLPPLVPPARVLEVLAEPWERITGLPHRDLRLVAVPRGIVARRVRTHSVRDRLDQRGAESFPGIWRRAPRGPYDRECVHPVAADPPD